MRYFVTLALFILICARGAVAMPDDNYEKAIFAGGCFWCMEKPFDKLDGVISTTSGYTGGHVDNPEYKQVSSGTTGHMEALQVVYDPSKVDYKKLLEVFWRQIDPLDGGGQFCDRGEQYFSAVFYNNNAEKDLADKSKKDISVLLNDTVHTKIIKASEFYPAEDYHQNYYKRNPIRYSFYRGRCGRDERLDELWGE